MSEKALILFDVDGTIFNSKSIILGGFVKAFKTVGKDVPDESDITRTIGLSLKTAIAQMAPSLNEEDIVRVMHAYKECFVGVRNKAPFYPGMRRLIGALAQYPHLTIGAATGKELRGLNPMLENNGMSGWFTVRQTPDNHPSKPHPSMIWEAIKTGDFHPNRVVMIGDTSFDIDMAHAADVKSIGVTWGYHGIELRASKPSVLVNCPSEIFENIQKWGLI